MPRSITFASCSLLSFSVCSVSSVVLSLCFGFTLAAKSEPSAKVAAPEFTRDIAPIFETKCNRCHGAKKRGGALDMRTTTALLKGGNSGPAYRSGDSEKSLLVELIHFNEMPP